MNSWVAFNSILSVCMTFHAISKFTRTAALGVIIFNVCSAFPERPQNMSRSIAAVCVL